MPETPKPWLLTLNDGTRVAVRRDLDQMTTYVLLEQEDWFEDEIPFVRRLCAGPGLALDVGANHGVYALSMARAHPQRRVVGFEPTTRAGALFAAGIEANALASKVTWVKAAVADFEGTGRMGGTAAPELAALGAAGAAPDGEEVPVLTLDGWWRQAGRPDVDFVKLDVEGAERAVLAGGRELLGTTKPVVMFELKHGGVRNEGLIEDFRGLGFGVYRLVPGLGLLTPFDGADDGYVLNLFAIAPERARALQEAGFLAGDGGQPGETDWAAALAQRPFAQAFLNSWATAVVPAQYRRALAHLLYAEDKGAAPVRRLASLQKAWALLETPGDDEPAWRLLACRVAHLLGLRARSVALAQSVLADLAAGRGPAWPFLPPMPEQDARAPVDGPGNWLWALQNEFILARSAFSSYFANVGPAQLVPLAQNPNHGLRVDRMLVLASLRANSEVEVPAAHALFDERLSPNAAIWRRLCFGVLPEALLEEGQRVRVVDVGASSHGRLTEPYAPLILMERAAVVGFEPDAEECRRLNEMYAGQGFRFLPRFVGRGGGATFHETNWVMTGSLYPPDVAVLGRYEHLLEVVTPRASHAVETVRLADVPEVEAIDLLKIDVQGAELDVFEGAGAKLDDALVIWTEVEFAPLYEGQPLFSEVERFLRERGFVFHAFDHLASRRLAVVAGTPLSVRRPQMLWADAIFVRHPDALQTLPTDRLRRHAVLMETVVRAPDHAVAALRELDRRLGTDLATRYLAGGESRNALAP